MTAADRSQRFWDRMAQRYDDAPRSQELQQAIDAAAQLLGPDDVVLDVGCGSGPVSVELRPRVRSVHGIDTSPAMIALARRHESNGLSFEVAAIDSPDLGARGFTAIVAFNVLHFLDLDAVVPRMRDLLPRGGRVFVLAACLDDMRAPVRWFATAIGRVAGMPRAARFSAQDLATRFETAGFEMESVARRPGWARMHWMVMRRR